MTKRVIENYIRLLEEEPSLFNDADGPIKILKDESEMKKAQLALSSQALEIGKPDHARLGLIHDGYYFRLIRDPVQFPSGNYGGYTRIVNASGRPNGVVILAYSGKNLILVRQFRHAVRGWRWEAPRGFSEEGEPALEAAGREFGEETGWQILDAEVVGEIEADSGVIGGACKVVLAKVVQNKAAQERDEDEAIDTVRLFKPSEIRDLTVSGKLKDGLTLSAISLASYIISGP